MFFSFQNRKALSLTLGLSTEADWKLSLWKCKLSRKRIHSTPPPPTLPPSPCQIKAKPLSLAFKALGLGTYQLWHPTFLLHPSMYLMSNQYRENGPSPFLQHALCFSICYKVLNWFLKVIFVKLKFFKRCWLVNKVSPTL